MILSALATLALLTQSLSTLDLIIENRQSALTFFYITILTLPQLIGIILPLAIFMATLFAYNRLKIDNELVVSKASGITPWQMSSPAMRIASFALLFHLILNILLQPLSFREFRQQVLKVKTDIASQVFQAGEFMSPAKGFTIFASIVTPDGRMKNVFIHDERDESQPLTYIAQEAYLYKKNEHVRLVLLKASYQDLKPDKTIRVLEVDRDSIDLLEFLVLDTTPRLKPSDRFLHELLFPDQSLFSNNKQKNELIAEGHARLSAPLYNWALTLLALCFLTAGQHKRIGYGKQISICVIIGFSCRLIGYTLTSASESTPLLNIAQYGFPLLICLISLWLINIQFFAKPIMIARKPSGDPQGNVGKSAMTYSKYP